MNEIQTIRINPSSGHAKYDVGAFDHMLGNELPLRDGEKILGLYRLDKIEVEDGRPILVFERIGGLLEDE